MGIKIFENIDLFIKNRNKMRQKIIQPISVSFVSFSVQNPKNETQAPTETRQWVSPKIAEISLNIWVLDRGTQH
jgi:hypothetical protein